MHLPGLQVFVHRPGGAQLTLQGQVIAHGREGAGGSIVPYRGVIGHPPLQIMELRPRTAQGHHMPRPRSHEQIGHQPAPLLVIGADRGDALAQIPVERNDRTADRRPIVRGVRGVRTHHDPIHHATAQHVDVLHLTAFGVRRRAQHRAQAAGRERALQRRRQRGEERVADRRHDDADQRCPPAVQVAGQLIGDVIQLPHRRLHTPAHLGGHVPGPVHDQRDGAQRHTGLPRHIAHSDHDALLLILVSGTAHHPSPLSRMVRDAARHICVRV